MNPACSDRIESHGAAVGPVTSDRVKCNYCAKEVRGYSRLQHHLGGVGTDVIPCLQCPDVIKDRIRNALIEKKKDRLLKEVGRLYHPELPLKRRVGTMSSQTRRCQLKPTVTADVESDSEVDVKPSVGQVGLGRNATSSGLGLLDSDIAEEVKSESELVAARCIGRFFFESGIDLKTVDLSAFQRMVDSVISCGVGYKAPRYDDLSGWVLRKELNATNARVKDIREYWEVTGCSILVDGWTDESGKSWMSFIVDCPQGRVFLRSVDVTDAVNDVDGLFYLISRVVEDVGVQNVVQVITHDSSCYMEAAGKKLVERYKTLFWTLCADHCINLILERIEVMDHVKKVLADAKTVTRFIYSHVLSLELMKKYIQDGDLVKSSKLRSVAAFLTLENMVSQKENLMRMFGSPTWNNSVWASRVKGKDICKLVKNPSFWATVEDVIKVTAPLLGILDQIKADKTPMGFVYDAMDRAKEAIKLNLGGREDIYLPLWAVIDDIWDNSLHSSLHSAGYYLNPSLFYSTDFYVDAEVTNGVIACVVRMVEDKHAQTLIVHQLDAYRAAEGGFSQEMAISQRTKVPPVLWWSLHGDSCPDLQRLAIRILSQTCSGALRCGIRKNLSTQLHGEGSNCIDRQMLSDLEFVRNNLHLCQSSPEGNVKGHVEELNPSDDWIVEC